MWHFHHSYGLGVNLIADAVEQFAQGNRPQAQQAEERGYYRYPSQEEFTAFQKMGGELITHQDDLTILQRFTGPVDESLR